MRPFEKDFDNPGVSPRLVSGTQSGQAAVETAIILPLLTFMVLGIIQLTMIQQASLMTEYAAYQAARAGVVWNGDWHKMEDAAIVVLTPTIAGGSGKLFPLAQPIHQGAAGLVDLGADVAIMQLVNKGAGALGLPKPVRVDTVNPTSKVFN